MSFWQTNITFPLLWTALFWLFVGLIAYTYVGYPLLLWLITRVRRQRLRPPSTVPQLTLLITAHNEAANIGRKLHQSLALNYPKERLQILVASDGSTDDTVDIVRSFASQGVDLFVAPQQRGKTDAQNLAVQRARGEIVVFSDATTEYHPDALRYLAGAFADENVGAVSGRYTYSDLTQTSSMGDGARAYAGYDNWLRQMQSAAGSITGCCGCIYAVRRSMYVPLAPDIISDLVEPLHVLLQGAEVKFEPRAVAREDATRGSGKEFSMRVRVITRALVGLASVKSLFLPWKHAWIALQLVSHKLLRYGVPLFLLGIFFTSLMLRDIMFYRFVLGSQIALYALALLSSAVPPLRTRKICALPLYFCIVNAAALLAMVQFLRGERYVIWRPQREPSHAN